MSVPAPDTHLWRRVAALEKQLASMEGLLRRMSTTRHCQPLVGRIWMVELTSDFDEETDTASADLWDLDQTDTGLDVTIEDPLKNYLDLGIGDGNKGIVEEQLDLSGKRHYIIVEWECP